MNPSVQVLDVLGADLTFPAQRSGALGCWGHRSCYNGKTGFSVTGTWAPGMMVWLVVEGALGTLGPSLTGVVEEGQVITV